MANIPKQRLQNEYKPNNYNFEKEGFKCVKQQRNNLFYNNFI